MIIETFSALGREPLSLPAVLVASHGPFAWGSSADDAVENAIALEVVATSAYRSLALAGELGPIPKELLESTSRASTGLRPTTVNRREGAAAARGR